MTADSSSPSSSPIHIPSHKRPLNDTPSRPVKKLKEQVQQLLQLHLNLFNRYHLQLPNQRNLDLLLHQHQQMLIFFSFPTELNLVDLDIHLQQIIPPLPPLALPTNQAATIPTGSLQRRTVKLTVQDFALALVDCVNHKNTLHFTKTPGQSTSITSSSLMLPRFVSQKHE